MVQQRRYYPLFVSIGTNYIPTPEREKSYHEKYEWIEGWLQYVTAVMRNDDGEILVGYNKKHNAWQIPSGKIDK